MKEIIQTNKSPKAIGPYSQAIKVSGSQMLFLSGNISLDPNTMELVGETAGEQCRQVMENISQVLKAGGADFSKVVKTTIYLADMNNFAEINEVYAGYFSEAPPARVTVEVSRLPKDVKVEIDAIAVL